MAYIVPMNTGCTWRSGFVDCGQLLIGAMYEQKRCINLWFCGHFAYNSLGIISLVLLCSPLSLTDL